MRRYRVTSPILMLLALTAAAAPMPPGLVTLAGVGNRQGWNDAHAYIDYVTLRLDGTDYTALCVDALHETAVNSNGSFIDSHGNQVAFSTANFGLLVDADYLGGQLQQAFLIDPPSSAPEPASMLLIGAGLVVLSVIRRKHLRAAGYPPGQAESEGFAATAISESTRIGQDPSAGRANG